MLSVGTTADGGSRIEISYTDAERLVQMVGHIPLAIDQAASYMKKTGSSPGEMLEMYQDNELPEVSKKKWLALQEQRDDS